MTHDELLAKINEECATTYEDSNGNVPISPFALRSVVELHQMKLDGVGRPQCSECTVGNDYRHYPCPTIQAIEKELQ